MNVKLYDTAKDFNKSCRKYLLLEEAKNNMFIGNLDNAITIYNDDLYLFGEITHQDQAELIFMCNSKGQMFLYTPTCNTDNQLYIFLSKELCKTNFQINGVKSDATIADLFAHAYSEQTKRNTSTNMRMSILVISKLNPINLLDLEVKKITLEDKCDLTQDNVKFIREGISGQEGLYFLMKNNIPVSQAAIRRKMSMGGVYTPEEYRRNGYSSTLVYQLTKKILDDGNSYCVVHTDADNIISNHMYCNIGFEHIANMKDIKFN